MKHQQDNHKDCANGHGADHFEIRIGDADQIPGARGLPNEHGVGIVPFHDRLQGVDLFVDVIACHGIFRPDQHQLPPTAGERLLRFRRDPGAGNPGTDQ